MVGVWFSLLHKFELLTAITFLVHSQTRLYQTLKGNRNWFDMAGEFLVSESLLRQIKSKGNEKLLDIVGVH